MTDKPKKTHTVGGTAKGKAAKVTNRRAPKGDGPIYESGNPPEVAKEVERKVESVSRETSTHDDGGAESEHYAAGAEAARSGRPSRIRYKQGIEPDTQAEKDWLRGHHEASHVRSDSRVEDVDSGYKNRY